MLGTRLGAAAVDAVLAGERSQLIGWSAGTVAMTPLREVVGKVKLLSEELLRLGRVLAR